jgi:hypothetical protein
LWTWRRTLPEILIFSISCGVLIMIAIVRFRSSGECLI